VLDHFDFDQVSKTLNYLETNIHVWKNKINFKTLNTSAKSLQKNRPKDLLMNSILGRSIWINQMKKIIRHLIQFKKTKDEKANRNLDWLNKAIIVTLQDGKKQLVKSNLILKIESITTRRWQKKWRSAWTHKSFDERKNIKSTPI
jgi:hypothetical protein